MKKYLYGLSLLLVTGLLFVACDDTETYAEQKARENKQIADFIKDNGIQVIKMSDFLKDTITNNPETGPDFSKNEYVLFDDNGVYMQIIRRGTGQQMQDGDRWDIHARYYEYGIAAEDTLTLNTFATYTSPDQFWCMRNGDNYNAGFTSGVMFSFYGAAVPKAWIMAFPFLKPGFLNGTPSAKIRLIVPHNQGTQRAATNVYPTFYEITLKPEKWQ